MKPGDKVAHVEYTNMGVGVVTRPFGRRSWWVQWSNGYGELWAEESQLVYTITVFDL